MFGTHALNIDNTRHKPRIAKSASILQSPLEIENRRNTGQENDVSRLTDAID